MSLKVTMVSTGTLTPSRDNPRNHSPEQIAKLMNSIEQFGFTNPILANGTEVVAGHGRLQAAKKLKMKTVPVIKLDKLSDKDRRIAYMIADNKIALEASWDLEKLNKHLSKLSKSLGVDITGFSEDDLKRIEDDLAEQALSNKRGTGGGRSPKLGSGSSGGTPPWEDDDDEDEEEEEEDLVHFQLLMEPEHREQVMAIVRALADKRDCTMGEALHTIVAAWDKGKGKGKR